jgi:MarR family transcriptional regulator, organic hydroperoxide resistance regulator
MTNLPPDRSFGHMMREVNRILQKNLGQRISQHGVSLGQWYALRVLWIQDGLTQSDIAQRAGVAPPQVVAALRKLMEAGMVVRDRHPTDQRKNVIFLTKRGRQLEAPCLGEAKAVNGSALAGVSAADFEICLRVLHRAKLNLEMPANELLARRERESGSMRKLRT